MYPYVRQDRLNFFQGCLLACPGSAASKPGWAGFSLARRSAESARGATSPLGERAGRRVLRRAPLSGQFKGKYIGREEEKKTTTTRYLTVYPYGGTTCTRSTLCPPKPCAYLP